MSVQWKYKKATTPSSNRIQFLVSKHHSLLKKLGLLGEMPNARSGVESKAVIYSCATKQEVFKALGGHIKKIQKQIWKGPPLAKYGTIWVWKRMMMIKYNTLNTKESKDHNEILKGETTTGNLSLYSPLPPSFL